MTDNEKPGHPWHAYQYGLSDTGEPFIRLTFWPTTGLREGYASSWAAARRELLVSIARKRDTALARAERLDLALTQAAMIDKAPWDTAEQSLRKTP